MLQLRLLGGAFLLSGGEPVTGRAAQRHRLALLAILASTPDGFPRDRAAALLWPDASTTRGRKLISDSVYRINRAAGAEVIQGAGDELLLDREQLRCDLWIFRRALGEGRWEEAVSAWRGPFLDGFFLSGAAEFDHWLEEERRRLEREYVRALEARATHLDREGDPAAAARAWEAVATADPHNARVACRLMEALDRAGERARAVAHARIHSRLMEELELDPEPAVLALAEEIRHRPSSGKEAPFQGTPSPSPPASGLPVVPEDPPSESPPGLPLPLETGGGGPWRRPPWRAAGVGLLLTLGLAGTFLTGNGPGDPLPPPSSLAVLPFQDLSPGGDRRYFSDGIAEDLMEGLSRIEGIRVAARTSSFAAREWRGDVREIGRRLGVEAVLEGSVRTEGDRLRITAHLVDTRDGYQLWTGSYDRAHGEVLAVQGDIARSIAATLRRELTGQPSGNAPAPRVEDAVAWDLYLRGRYAWHRRTEEGLRTAVTRFQEAVERSPEYAAAWVGLGDAWAVLGFYDHVPPDEAFPRAEEAARRALSLDPGNAPAQATLGYVALYYQWDPARAEEAFREAIRRDPGYSTGHQWYANFLTAAGRFPEAEASMRRARELDPLSLIANAALGWVLYFAGRDEEALTQARNTLDLDPDFDLAHLWSGWSLERMGRTDEALRELESAVARSEGSALARSALARLRAARGEEAEARRILRELEASQAYIPSYEVGKAYLALGEVDRALEWLERAWQERSHSMVFLAVDPQLEPLREDPRFRELVTRVGFAGR